MATITSRTFLADGVKKALSIGNEEYVRKLACGNEWNYLRIMFSLAITPNGTSNMTGTRLAVGLCANSIQGRTYNSANTTNYIGFLVNHTDEAAGQTLTYNAGSGNPYYSQTTARGAYITRVGGTSSKTNAAINGGTVYISTTGGSLQRRCLIAVDILRNTPLGSGTANWQIGMGAVNTGPGAVLDHPVDLIKMWQLIPGIATDPMTGGEFLWTDIVNAPVNPNESANGILDTVSIFWNQASFPVEIYDLYVFRLR